MGHTEDCTLDVGCAILREPVVNRDCHKKTMVRVSSPVIPGVFQPYFHYDCLHNQVRSIVGRVAGPVVKPSEHGLALLRVAAEHLGRTLPKTQSNDLFDMPARYSGAKRTRYERAAEALCVAGLFIKDAFCKMFVKAERIDGCAKKNPDPRAIQFRGSKYCVALAAYLHPIEHALYHTEFASSGVPKTRNIAKGLNSVQRAEVLNEKLAFFQSPVVLSIDASRFDKHVSKQLLMIEHSVYLASNPAPQFALILAMQLVNTVFTSLGLKYRVEGRRMSGDMNTACGNCVLMILMLYAFCKLVLNLARWDCFDDGDDCLLIVEAKDVSTVQSTLAPQFLSFGMEMKVESPVDSLHKIVFCQSSVVEYEPGRFKFVRDYRNIISKSLCGLRHWQDPHYRKRVLKAIGTCELVLNLSVPVLQSFACAILRNVGGRARDLHYAPDGLRARASRDARALGLELSKIQPRPIQECARSSFELAFGLSPTEQINLERELDSWVFRIDGLVHWGGEWSVHDWLPNFSNVEVQALRQNAEHRKTNCPR